MRTFVIHFWVAGEWMYDTIEANSREEAIDAWWSDVKSTEERDFEVENGTAILRAKTSEIPFARVRG